MRSVANMFHMLSNRGGRVGLGGCENVLDEYNTGPTELVAFVNMLHMLSYGQQEGWGVGGWGVIMVLTNIT